MCSENWAIIINEMKNQGIDFRKGASELANGDLQATLAFQWAAIRHNGSSLALEGLIPGASNYLHAPISFYDSNNFVEKPTTPRKLGAGAATEGAGAKSGAASSSAAAGASGAAGSSTSGTTGAPENKPDTTKQVAVKEQILRYLNSFLPPHLQISNFTTRYAANILASVIAANIIV